MNQTIGEERLHLIVHELKRHLTENPHLIDAFGHEVTITPNFGVWKEVYCISGQSMTTTKGVFRLVIDQVYLVAVDDYLFEEDGTLVPSDQEFIELEIDQNI